MIALYLTVVVLSAISLWSGDLITLAIALGIAFACIAKEEYDRRQ